MSFQTHYGVEFAIGWETPEPDVGFDGGAFIESAEIVDRADFEQGKMDLGLPSDMDDDEVIEAIQEAYEEDMFEQYAAEVDEARVEFAISQRERD